MLRTQVYNSLTKAFNDCTKGPICICGAGEAISGPRMDILCPVHDAPPDKNCISHPDGSCTGIDCMHDPHPQDESAKSSVLGDTCPRCGGQLDFDEVDIGVGTLRGNPGCPDCHWVPGRL